MTTDPDPNQRFAIAGRRVVTPDGVRPAAVVIDGGGIEAVEAPDAVSLPVIDFGDAVIGPGLVDAHVHINEPGRTEWEGFATATAAAAAGGVTTLVDMPLNSSPVVTTLRALDAKRASATGKLHVDIALYGGLVAGSAADAIELAQAGVAGIKAFLCDSGLEEFPAADEADLRQACPHLAKLGVPLLVHAELATPVAPVSPDPRTYADYLASRPSTWELDAIAMLIGVCRDTGCHIHIVHLASAEALPMIAAAKAEGLPLTVETCPHYLCFAAEDIKDGATQFKCAPPIRKSTHREALWQAVADGLIDTIGSDHSPCPPSMKRLDSGDFTAAWGGIAGLELSLPVVFTGAEARGIDIERVFTSLSTEPAELVGLGEQKGQVAPGYDADLTVFDPESTWRVNAQQLHHRHQITPYDGLELRGKVLKTYLRGQSVFETQKLFPARFGRLLAPRFDAA